MAATAIDDAKRFLDLHPWSTTDVDNPVELLRAVVDEYHSDLEETIEDSGMKPDDIEEKTGAVQRLCAFIKGLRDDMKISEAEYRTALTLVEAE